MRKREEIKAMIFFVSLVITVLALIIFCFSFWDGKVGVEDNGDGRWETLYIATPFNAINPSAGDYHNER